MKISFLDLNHATQVFIIDEIREEHKSEIEEIRQDAISNNQDPDLAEDEFIDDYINRNNKTINYKI